MDNALNAQKDLPDEKRKIKIMLKTQNDRTLLSVKNPFSTPPLFVDGMPVSKRKGHGYGTQSICYMTEKLGGDCRIKLTEAMEHFSTEASYSVADNVLTLSTVPGGVYEISFN